MSSSRVYVGKLSYQVREKDVERFFRGIGRIRDINLKNGFGFVEFDDPRDAEDAVYECSGRELLGERIIVEHARGTSSGYGRRYGGGRDRDGRQRYNQRREPVWLNKYGPPTRTDHRLIVENISSRVSWQDLKDFMRQAGEITYADAHKQRVGEGIVEYASREDMKNALRKLDGKELNGRKLRLTADTEGSSRRRSRSRSRSRSRGRSRSRSRSHSRSPSRSRSRSRDRDRSRSHSKSPGGAARRSRSRSHSRDRSREGSEPRRSRSASPAKDESREQRERSRSHSRSRSRSRSPKREHSRSLSPKRSPPAQEMRSRSASPVKSDHE